jgi:hypothetical protein
MNLVVLFVASIAAYILGMAGLVAIVAADKESKIGPGLRFGGWFLMMMTSVIVIGILAEIGNNT